MAEPEPDYEGVHSAPALYTNGVVTSSMSNVRGSTVSFHNLDYSVKISKPCCRSVDKQILFDVSGVFRPGMNAIMGPTGSGKTTLLDILAARCETDGLSGAILVDNRRPPKNYKCMTGYVVQDDVVMGTLTVRENLMFSANLRLPQTMTAAEREAIVDNAISELGLERCANTKIGTEFIRGVSGGERKRTNIGMELIISPAILFLDEPTTGLDANTANAVMSLLHRLSRKGGTVIFSIHQPRFSIYKLFDRLSLLAAGRTVYHGKSPEALEFFSQAGYECEEYNNPPDFFLDVINSDASIIGSLAEDSDNTQKELIQTAVKGDDSSIEMGIQSAAHVDKKRDVGQELVDRFRQSRWNERLNAELAPIMSEYQQNNANHEEVNFKTLPTAAPQYATSFMRQLGVVSRRAFLNFLRNPQSSIMQNAVSIFFSVILGLIFLQLPLDQEGQQSRYGALFFLAVNQLFSNLSAIELFIKERAIFAHESASGFYRVSVYFFSKVFCDLLPMRVIPLILFTIIVYFMIGFQVNAGKFFFFFLALLLCTIAASAMAFAVSATIAQFSIANLLTVLIYIISMIFGGLLVNLKGMGAWLNWIQYLSIVRYCLSAISINEFTGLQFSRPNSTGTTTGEDFLDYQGVAHGSAWDLWRNIMALGLIALGIEFLAYVQLRRMKKLK